MPDGNLDNENRPVNTTFPLTSTRTDALAIAIARTNLLNAHPMAWDPNLTYTRPHRRSNRSLVNDIAPGDSIAVYGGGKLTKWCIPTTSVCHLAHRTADRCQASFRSALPLSRPPSAAPRRSRRRITLILTMTLTRVSAERCTAPLRYAATRSCEPSRNFASGTRTDSRFSFRMDEKRGDNARERAAPPSPWSRVGAATSRGSIRNHRLRASIA